MSTTHHASKLFFSKVETDPVVSSKKELTKTVPEATETAPPK